MLPSNEGKKKQFLYDYVPEPNCRGRGSPAQRAFRESTYPRGATDLPGQSARSRKSKDLIVATVTSVVSPEWDVDVETIKRHQGRQRKRKRQLSDDPD